MFMSRINKKHFLIFNNGGIISVTTPKDWARANQSYFPSKDFSNSDNTPTSGAIEKVLTEEFNFRCIENDEVFICYDYDSL
jgi:hypothetical protein